MPPGMATRGDRDLLEAVSHGVAVLQAISFLTDLTLTLTRLVISHHAH